VFSQISDNYKVDKKIKDLILFVPLQMWFVLKKENSEGHLHIEVIDYSLYLFLLVLDVM